ncbi:MAG: carbonic anhydrase [Oligoflexia bacterium]|nr:carbonic anhydrase [Oligoflexia bacterium]
MILQNHRIIITTMFCAILLLSIACSSNRSLRSGPMKSGKNEERHSNVNSDNEIVMSPITDSNNKADNTNDEDAISDANANVVSSNVATPMEAFQYLLSGNLRFVQNRMAHPQQQSATRDRLLQGQKPYAIVLSCSDSRVPPEIIFDQGLGQIFVVRTAGHVVDKQTIGSIEYAIEHLGSRLLVILGHDSCGAVTAALGSAATAYKDGGHSGSQKNQENIESIIRKINSHLIGNKSSLDAAVRSNVNGTVKDLMISSKIIREYVERGELLFASGIYHLESGKTEFWSIGIPIFMGREASRDRVEASEEQHSSNKTKVIARKYLYQPSTPQHH